MATTKTKITNKTNINIMKNSETNNIQSHSRNTVLGEVKTKHYLNSLDELIKQGNDLNNELDKCLDLQEQTIKELQRTNKILDALNFA